MLSFEITKMLLAVLKTRFIVSFIIIFGTLSYILFEKYMYILALE